MSDDLEGGLGEVLPGATWAASQYLPGDAAVATLDDEGDPKTKKGAKKPATTMPATDRILTGSEFAAAQRKSADAVKAWQIPKMPTIAPRDLTTTAIDRNTEPRGTPLEGNVAKTLLGDIINPALEHPIQTSLTALGGFAGGVTLPWATAAAMALPGATDIARYGYQKYVTSDLSPDARKELEADPEWVTGHAAAAQAIMLGAGALIGVGVKGVGRLRSAFDYGAGMTEAGVSGLSDLHTTQEASPTRLAASQYESRRLAEDQQDLATERKTLAAELAGDVPEQQAPFTRVPRSEAYRTAADDYAARRLAEDQADLADTRRTEADRVLAANQIRRRAGGAAASEDANPFMSEHGAEVLGTLAARGGLPNEASPYVPDSPNDVAWKSGHAAATESFPEGFSMGGAESRIPAASEIPKTARGSDTPVPEGVTPETAALAAALKPSRFRGHSLEQLDESLLDAQKRLQDAQAAEFHHSEGQIGTQEWQDRVDNNQETEVYYAKRREMETSRARSQLAQIEREYALRGVTGDQLAERVQAAQEARLERQAMQEDESLAFITGKPGRQAAPTFDPFGDESTPAPAGGAGGGAGSPPVEGTGEPRTRGLASAIERKAIANKLTASLGDLPEYNRVSMADQAEQAAALLARDPALARRVALGEAPAPEGLLPESVLVAVERKAVTEGDVATLRDLATGNLGEQITHMGQRIRALAERDPDSPVGAIQQVVDARTAAGNKVPRATEDMVAAIRAKLSETSISAENLAEFLKSLEC